MFTPAISTGYWNAMNTPSRARSSGSMSRRSRPSNSTSPPVTTYSGCPDSARASVLLPDPFGPHDGVHFAGVDVEIDPLQDLLVLGLDLEILDIEHVNPVTAAREPPTA